MGLTGALDRYSLPPARQIAREEVGFMEASELDNLAI